MPTNRKEFVVILTFTLLIPILVTIIQLIIYKVQGFIGMSFYFISNMVPSIIAYSGVVVLQNIFAIGAKKSKLNIFTIITFILLIAYSILYAVHLSFTGYDDNQVAMWTIPLTLIVMTVAMIALCIISNIEAKHPVVMRKKWNLSGEDY